MDAEGMYPKTRRPPCVPVCALSSCCAAAAAAIQPELVYLLTLIVLELQVQASEGPQWKCEYLFVGAGWLCIPQGSLLQERKLESLVRSTMHNLVVLETHQLHSNTAVKLCSAARLLRT